MEKFYLGRGNYEQFKEYMQFINDVYKQDMTPLLPRIYREESAPAESSYVITEDGRIKGVVGAYRSDMQVCGTYLTGIGIGNVGVDPECRSKGYMKKMMDLALEDMIADGIDFTVLGGQRQLYNAYSYERAGMCYVFLLNRTNMQRVFGKEKPLYYAAEVNAQDTEALDAIEKIYSNGAYVPIRERKDLYETLCSWKAKVYVIKNGEKIIGYFVLKGRIITEFLLEQDEQFTEALRAMMDIDLTLKYDVDLWLPPFLPTYIKALETIAEHISIAYFKSYSVLNYEKVLKAFMKLKSGYTNMPNGQLVALIHGKAKDEQLLIKVQDHCIYVEKTQMPADVELSHLEAMRYFFAPVCAKREACFEYVQKWFPLPLWLYNADSM